MKNEFKLILVFVALFAWSCGSDQNETSEEEDSGNKSEQEADKTCTYSFDESSTSVNWTGYKHSTKAAVPGIFEFVSFEGPMTSGSVHELLLGIEGIVETNSVYSNDTTRDRKLKQFFFNNMVGAETISARMIEMAPTYDANGNAKGTGKLSLTMNGVTFSVPAKYSIEDLKVTVDADITIEDFNGQKSFDAIAEACSEKHTLESDGKPVTWPEFHINITTKVVEICD